MDDGRDQPLRVLQLTDTHLYAQQDGALLGLNTEASLLGVIQEALTRHGQPQLVLATGDLAHDATPEGYQRFQTLMEVFEAPVYCLAGNHDEAATLEALFPADNVHYAPYCLLPGWVILFLDSSVPGEDGGHLSAAELQRLDETLAAHRDRHALVCVHHQPVPVGSAWLDTMAIDNAEAFFEVVDRHPQVRGILWGHVHQTFDGERRGVRLMATPSTCIQFAPHSDAFAVDNVPPGYRWLELHADGRIESAVERVREMPDGLELASGGY